MKIANAKRRILGLLFAFMALPLVAAGGNPQSQSQKATAGDSHVKGSVVYVCACLKTKSCSCMTEAKMEGPCACGTEGGPPLKAVAANSAWAKANRKALAH